MKKTELENCPAWLLNAQTEDENVKTVDRKLIWLSGMWLSGTWEGSIWEGGTWAGSATRKFELSDFIKKIQYEKLRSN